MFPRSPRKPTPPLDYSLLCTGSEFPDTTLDYAMDTEEDANNGEPDNTESYSVRYNECYVHVMDVTEGGETEICKHGTFTGFDKNGEDHLEYVQYTGYHVSSFPQC